MPRMVAAQIKSGVSYCSKNQCHIKSDREHFEYWFNHQLPVVVIVYDPNEKEAYWQSIKSVLDKNKIKNGPYTILFSKNDLNKFDKKFFENFIKPKQKQQQRPRFLNFKTCAKYVMSDDPSIFNMGVYSLIKKHSRRKDTWDLLFHAFRTKPAPGIHGELIDMLSSIIDHHNMWWYGRYTYNLPFEKYLRKKIMEFTKEDVIRMLSFIYEEDDFTRIHISKRINDILGLIPNRKDILIEIVENKEQSLLVRNSALMFLACYEQGKILSYLKKILKHNPEIKDGIDRIRWYWKKPSDEVLCFD